MDRNLTARQRKARQLGRRLATISESAPRIIRQRLLESIMELVDADGACFYSVCMADQRRHVPTAQAVGTADVRRCAAHIVGSTGSIATSDTSLRDFARPRRLERSSFVEDTALWDPERYFESLPYQRVLAPFGLRHQQRLLAYHGTRFLGWVGALRGRGARPFSSTDRRGLQPLVQPAITALLTAERLERASQPDEAGDIVMDARGRPVHASTSGRAWLQHTAFPESLAERVREIDRGRSTFPRHFAVGCAEVRLVRLDGTSGVRYLAHVRRLRSLQMHPDSTLTDRQREVAHLAAAGATVPEIAKMLGASTETIRSHLRAVYRKLEVSNRVELAATLSDVPPG